VAEYPRRFVSYTFSGIFAISSKQSIITICHLNFISERHHSNVLILEILQMEMTVRQPKARQRKPRQQLHRKQSHEKLLNLLQHHRWLRMFVS
jgi:hypothetical protein